MLELLTFFFRSGKMTLIKSIIDFPKPTLLFHIVVEYRHLHRYFRYTIQCICFINCSFENVCLCFFSNAELCTHCTVQYSMVDFVMVFTPVVKIKARACSTHVIE